MKAIIATNNLSYVGLNNKLPWKCKVDLIHFKQLTSTSDKNKIPKLLVGHNTSLKLPKLPGREIFVNTKNCSKLFNETDIDWCIGGKKTYEKYCHLFTELHISHIDDDTIGDVMFPDLRNLNPECKIFHYYFNVDKPLHENDVYRQMFLTAKDEMMNGSTFSNEDKSCNICKYTFNDVLWYYVEVKGIEPNFHTLNFDEALDYLFKKIKK